MSDEGDDSSPPRPKRKIKKIVFASSSSDSESDESGPATSTRKKRLRVLSEDESESGSSAVVSRRRKRLPGLRDSDSDTSGWGSEPAGAAQGPSQPVRPTSGFASDSSEGNSDKCSICLMRFREQEVGTPQTCEHIFCLDCITEWSRNVNTCPVDRLSFDSIVVRACAGGRVLRTQPVQVLERPPSVEMLLIEDPTSCEICGGTNREDTMLLCDACDLGYHMECLTPPLTQIPLEQWLCPSCTDRLHVLHVQQASSDIELFSDASEEWVRLSQWARRRGESQRRRRAAPHSGPAGASGSARRRAPAPRRRTHKRRRARTIVIEYEVQEHGKAGVTRRLTRKLRHRKRRGVPGRTAARRAQVRRSVRAVLAAQRAEHPACAPRALGGLAPALSLFGSARDLEYFSGDELEADTPASGPGPGGVALAARAPPSSAAIAAYRQARRKTVCIPSPAHATAAPDILSSILESQTLLHSRRADHSLTGSGRIHTKLRPEKSARPPPHEPALPAGGERVRPGGAGGAARQAPSYPGQARGGGWGGGYRYPAERAPPPAAPSRASYDNGYGPVSGGGGRGARPEQDGYQPYEHRWPRYSDPPEREWRPHRERARPDDPLDMRLRCGPLPAPPPFPVPPDEEEAGLVIDTDKYDPTEPTDDGDEVPPPPPLAPPASLAAVESLLAGGDVLEGCVRQVLREHHRDLLPPQHHDSDEGSDGDCPNFSIYSAASVHIAATALEAPPAPAPAPAPPPAPPLPDRKAAEYNEKVSKRCPITTNTRNPIKIKLNSPALIRRQVSLYDDEDAPAEPEADACAPPVADAPPEPEPEPEHGLPVDTPPADTTLEHTEPDATTHAETNAEPDTPAEQQELLSEDNEETPLPVTSQETEPSQPPEEGDDSPGREHSAEPEREVAGEEAGREEEADTSGTPSLPEEAQEEGGHSPAREKMTESISETEDERSYTPCLDEQQPARDPGLGTELISEDEGDGLFSEEERAPADPPRRRKKKEKPKERKPKPAKAGKKGTKSKRRSRSPSAASGARSERRREKRADLERYDVRTLVSERRRRGKDAFGRDVSPREPERASASASPRRRPSLSPRRPSLSPRRRVSLSPRRRISLSPRRPSISPRRRVSLSPRRPSLSPRRRVSLSPRRRPSVSPRRRTSPPPRRARASPSPRRLRASPSPRRVRASPSPRRVRASPSPSPLALRRSPSPRAARRRRRSSSRARRAEAKRRRSGSRTRKRRRSGSPPATKTKAKKKKRARSERARSRSRSRKKSPKRKRVRRRSGSAAASPVVARAASPRTPPPPPALVPIEQRRLRKRRDRSKHRRLDTAPPSKEVFTSGDNILVSVSFAEAGGGGGGGEVARRERRAERRRRRRATQPDVPAKPVAIIDLARSPCRELTPSPQRVIVLSDEEAPAPPAPPQGPQTPPAPAEPAPAPEPAAARGPLTPPEPPDSPDAYDPYEPTASPPPAEEARTSPPRVPITLEAAQKTNMSADEVLDRRPLSPIEKVMALLQSTRDAPPDPPPEGGAAAAAAAAAPPEPPRVQLPEAPRAPAPKLFLAKPSPIKSDPIKPMPQATKISRLPLPALRGDSPYSPGSSDFGDLFEPPAPPHHAPDHFDALLDKPTNNNKRKRKQNNKKKGKTQVEVKLDDDNLKVLDELPSSAVEMQVKSKFLKKLNRQERVVEEVKLVLKPHYNKKHVTKDEYKHILRRAVPKICHNKTGEINPSKIQALVEAYVSKFRKRRKRALQHT